MKTGGPLLLFIFLTALVSFPFHCFSQEKTGDLAPLMDGFDTDADFSVSPQEIEAAGQNGNIQVYVRTERDFFNETLTLSLLSSFSGIHYENE